MKSYRFLSLLLLPLLLAACAVKPSDRERIREIENYIVYYGEGRAEELSRYDLAILQPETLDQAGLKLLHRKGTLVVAYLSIGEVELYRPWYIDGRVDPGWILGKNEDWGSYFIDASQPGWQDLMTSVAGEYIAKGFDGIFLDTVDTVDIYPETSGGMIALIHGLRAAYPNALIVQNRGFSVVDDVATDIDVVMFEDLSTTYNFEKQEYIFIQDSGTADLMMALHERTGLPILALDYAPPDNPGMAYRAVQIARGYGFIPAVSVINLDDIPDYDLESGGPADLRVVSVRAEGDENNVTLVARIQNVGLENATDVPMNFRVNGGQVAELNATFAPGDSFDWQVDWPAPMENVPVEVAVSFSDPTPADNTLTWTFTYASIAMELLLPPDQQRRRPAENGAEMTASYLVTEPVIDGDLSEWAGLPCTDVGAAENISYGDAGSWYGLADLSGRVCYGWDDGNVYVAFAIKDDVIVQQYMGGNLWMGDHVELWFDTQLQLDFDSTEAGDDDYQLGISPGDFADVPPDFVIFTPPSDPIWYKAMVECVVVRTDTGYAAELKIPKQVLRGLRLADGHAIAATFEPSDTDTPGGSDQELMLSSAPGSSSNWGDPSYWNNLVFIK
jgi:endo-alpha-1,4-polygalactosaminidase (GH114 family)